MMEIGELHFPTGVVFPPARPWLGVGKRRPNHARVAILHCCNSNWRNFGPELPLRANPCSPRFPLSLAQYQLGVAFGKMWATT